MNEDDPTPCHSDESHVLPSISFLLIFCGLIVSITHCLASDSAAQLWETLSNDTGEHVVGFPDVYFDVDSMKIDKEGEDKLQSVIRYLMAHPDASVTLEGHVDEHYSQTYAYVPSARRAKLVKSYLRDHGVTNRIETHGYGRDRPRCLERSEECRRENNRVHILVLDFRKVEKPRPLEMSMHSHGSAPRVPEPATEQDSEPQQSHSHAAPAFDYPTIYFKRNSFELSEKALESLSRLVVHLKNHPDLAIRLNGHVDERHTSAYGFPLSDKRATAVQEFLRISGVRNTIQIVGYGKENPICFERNEACYRISNQVDVIPEHF